VAGDLEELGALVLLAAEALEPGGAAAEDVGTTAMLSTLLTVVGQP
jgi:hypothetical protein